MFTEVALELADSRHPLCRLSRPPQRAYAIYRPLDAGELTRRQRAHLALRGSPEAVEEVIRELRAPRPDGQPPSSHVEVLHQAAGEASLLLESPTEGSTGLAAIAPVLLQHGLPPILEPIVVSEGRARIRLVIPRHVEAQEVLRAFQEVQRACGFAEFRIQRIGALQPAALVEGARRTLPPEQEALLGLAASMGYYETPKAVTLEEISRAVGLSISPVHKRLKSAEETIVALHVAQPPQAGARRRARPTLPRAEPATPVEVQLRARGDIGPCRALADVPGARASLHVTSVDGGRAQLYTLVVIAPEDVHAKLVPGLEDRPDVANVQVVERSPQHIVCRITSRERGAYALSWWTDVWGQDAVLRSIVLEGGEAHVRALLARPLPADRLQQRLQDSARAAGWSEWELLSARPLANGSAPPVWPDPLTQRQLEVLRVAHALGYYRTPRSCTLEHVANTLGVSANAIHKNLVLAESKLIAAYLAAGL